MKFKLTYIVIPIATILVVCKNRFNSLKEIFGMKFDFEPQNLFTVGELKKCIKDNLKGNFTWGGYVKNTKPDSKFGHTKLEYLTQIPFIGLVFTGVVYAILIVVTYPAILFQQIKEKLNAK